MNYLIDEHRGRACPDLQELQQAATAEGHSFVARTRQEWDAGVNRFNHAGEVFFLAVEQGRVVGMCGLNHDPYVDDPTVGRLRHLYVHPNDRRTGIAARLVAECLTSAATSFERIRLRTSNPAAAALYQSLGFVTIDSPTATHELRSKPEWPASTARQRDR